MIIIFKHSLGLKDACHLASKSAIKAYRETNYKNKKYKCQKFDLSVNSYFTINSKVKMMAGPGLDASDNKF